MTPGAEHGLKADGEVTTQYKHKEGTKSKKPMHIISRFKSTHHRNQRINTQIIGSKRMKQLSSQRYSHLHHLVNSPDAWRDNITQLTTADKSRHKQDIVTETM